MKDYESQSDTKWYCVYHIVFIPKYRRKRLFQEIRETLGDVFRDLARQRECEILEGKLLLDHVHMMISIPPKYSVAQIVGFIKGKSAINIARRYMGRKRNFKGQHFWARGYFVSTIGADEETVQKYIKDQEDEDRRFDQQELF